MRGPRPAVCSDVVDGAQKPNIIVVLAGDQGYVDLACIGNPILKTPELDRLNAIQSALPGKPSGLTMGCPPGGKKRDLHWGHLNQSN